MPTYEIPEENMPKLTETISKLQTKAEKLGTGNITFTIDGSEMRENKEETVKVFFVTVEGETPKLNGWQFAAKIEHLPAGNVISGLEEVPERFRTVEPICDYCHKKRNRKDTYIVVKDGEYRQVGSSCLKDFTGHKNPEGVAEFAEMLIEFMGSISDSEYDPDRIYHSPYYKIADYLAYVAQAIRKHGWVSRSKEVPQLGIYSTADTAISEWNNKYKEEYPNEADSNIAAETITWVQAFDGELNDYQHNLSVIFSDKYFEIHHAGYVASAVAGMLRDKEQKVTMGNSEYQGTIKVRQEWTLNLISVKTMEDRGYGPSYLHKFQDETGNVFIWFSSSARLDEGNTYTGKGTVKAHKEFRSEKQTVLTRCKFERKN